MSNALQCHVFGEIPGVHKSWTLAVISVSLADAREYIRCSHKGGKLQFTATPGSKVQASCGATTEKAQAVIHEELEREWDEYQTMKAKDLL